MSDETPSPTPSPADKEPAAETPPPKPIAPAVEPQPEPPPAPSAEEKFTERVCREIPEVSVYARKSNHAAVQTDTENLVAVMRNLRDNPEFDFATLCDHTAVDRPEEAKIELLYHVYSLTQRKMLLVSVDIPREKPVAPTLREVWKIAEWQEREVYDLFGVLYDNHPDLRRVFLEDDWKGFPLRKDYQDEFMIAPQEEQD